MLKLVQRNLALRVSSWLLVAFALVFAPVVAIAHAEDIASTLEATPALGDLSDTQHVAQLVLNAVMTKQWGLLASLLVLLIVAALRKYVPEKTKVGMWLRTRPGGIVTNVLVSLAGAFSTLFLSGAQFSADMVLKALSIALGASGGWSIWKNLNDALNERRAQAAGKAAAENPADVLNQ
jgi:hypothetical protein